MSASITCIQMQNGLYYCSFCISGQQQGTSGLSKMTNHRMSRYKFFVYAPDFIEVIMCRTFLNSKSSEVSHIHVKRPRYGLLRPLLERSTTRTMCSKMSARLSSWVADSKVMGMIKPTCAIAWALHKRRSHHYPIYGWIIDSPAI